MSKRASSTADSSAYSHRKRAKSIDRSDGTALDEVERLQAKLDAVLTTLNDSSLAPEDAISRALAAAVSPFAFILLKLLTLTRS